MRASSASSTAGDEDEVDDGQAAGGGGGDMDELSYTGMEENLAIAGSALVAGGVTLVVLAGRRPRSS